MRSSSSGSLSTSRAEDRSLHSVSTSTSTSTFVGPGSVAGRVIQNLGKLTLRGVEQIIVSRRLSSIAAYFPHKNASGVTDFLGMYLDLLELSRIHLYPDTTRIRALQLIIGQIASRYTGHLIQALLAWPEVEVKLLISEILARFDRISTDRSPKSLPEDALVSAYLQNLSKRENHPLSPIVDFLRDFASSSGEKTWSIVINCGSLNLLLYLYLSNFGTPVAFNIETGPFQKCDVSATCNSFLMETLADSYALRMIHLHPLRGLWPLWPMLSFETVGLSRSTLRSQTWQTLDRKHIQWRISSIFDTLVVDWVKGRNIRITHMLHVDYILFDMLVDLLEFSGSSMLDDDTCFRALRSLHRLLTRCFDPDQVNAGIAMYMEQTRPDHAREIFIRIIHRLTLLLGRSPESDAFFAFCYQNCQPQSCPLDPDASVHFIHRFLTTSESNETLRRWLILRDSWIS